MNQKQELKTRVVAKQKELEARIATLQADAGAAAREERAKLERKLREAKEQVKNGWDQMTEDVAAKLNAWLADEPS